jgi:hypothetical protein
MANVKNKKNQVSRVQQLVAGTNKHFPNGSDPLSFGGVTRTVAALTQLLQSYLDTRSAVVASQATTKAKLAGERAQSPPLLAAIDEYVAFLRARFGDAPDALADFGLAPPKARVPPTAEQQAIAAAKRKATREARHTLGKNQKKGTKGAITAALVVTPAPGSPPTAVGAPTATTGAAPAAAVTADRTSAGAQAPRPT